ncbi:amylo-alpha-1,6-glucosidase [Cerasicoccus arenae]|nr:amylo-alpha-1,6-glucosidase [Cerasicoccus arenae]MBK1857200.1 hypothetical protein [Cerasicoccus arenae]
MMATCLGYADDGGSRPESQASITLVKKGDVQGYELTTRAELRDNRPEGKRITIEEDADYARTRTGNVAFDGLYALAIREARENSVNQISDYAYANGESVNVQAFQTGEKWSYVWTRDLAYSLHLSLAAFNPERAAASLMFKASALKPSVRGGYAEQMVQDTGSGGSYPISSDRVVWAIGAHETMKYLSGSGRRDFLSEVYPILCNTIEQDRCLVFDPRDGLYRGEHSFLDWREQSYPQWSADNVGVIGNSKAVSVNAANYFLLKTAAEYAGALGDGENRIRYQLWADELKAAINQHFYDEEAGLYRTYLLSEDGVYYLPLKRYDLLGQSLAILLDVADERQVQRVIASYPTGPFGPPVIWPEVKNVPIYHNQGIWPFVTAYWTKAARQANNPAAVDAGIDSLMTLAMENLSNMENYDYISGKADVRTGPRHGPVINSRRQLWSVAGYLSMVQDVVFGMETSLRGIQFQPYITAGLRNELFADTNIIELNHLAYKDKWNDVRVHLPAVGSFQEGVCTVARVMVNGVQVPTGFVEADALLSHNQWEIFLEAPVGQGSKLASIRVVDVTKEKKIFGPLQPEWDDARGAVMVVDGKLRLSFRHDEVGEVVFNIYRNGKRCAENLRVTEWVDLDSGNYADTIYAYVVEAVYPESGNVSHPTQSRAYRTENQRIILPSNEMKNRGGNLSDQHHFENWGRPNHELTTNSFQVDRAGVYHVRMEFSNGSGPINTGITCAVKRLEVRQSSGPIVGAGYVVMPQSGSWLRWDLSNAIEVELQSGEDYQIHLSEDEYSRNMSYLQSNERYTASNGGGRDPYNYVNIASAQVFYNKPIE